MRVPYQGMFWHVLLAGGLVLAAARCGDNSTSPGATAGKCGSAQDLSSCLPSWQEFSPKLPDEAPTPDADSTPTSSDVTDSLQRIDSSGNLVSLGNVTFVCTDTTYDFVDNPDQALSFNLDETKIWPGALIQGQTFRDGKGMSDLQELPIKERAPVTLTLTFNNKDNTQVIDNPDQGSVNQAKGAIIANAQAESLATANNIDFKEDTYSSERQAALAFGVSGRYLGFEASAKGSVSKSVSTSVVVAQFKQQMYIAGVSQPATPADFFSDAFTADKYKAQADLGRIGPDNPPLYVSRIGYGRMMVFSMSAKATASDVEGALNAAYKGIAGSAAVHLSAKDSAILSSSEIRISQIGGDQTNALRAIQSGQLSAYFTETAPLTSAAPLWFELKTLTGQTATVSEPGTYTQTTCTPKLPGTFDFQPEQTLSIPFTAGTQRQTLQADVNGDGKMDIVFDELRTSPSLNIVHVALANGDGTFTLQSPDSISAAPAEGWENFQLVVGDMNGDGRVDLIWNGLLSTNNIVYTALSNGDGTFALLPRQELPSSGWNLYHVVAGDLNGDGRADLLWDNTGGSTTIFRTYYALARADSTFAMAVNFSDKAGNYSGYGPPMLAQLDGANGKDYLVNALGGAYNNTYLGLFTPTSDTTGFFTYPDPPIVYGTSGWANDVARVGDIDGQHAADVVFVRPDGTINRALNNGKGVFAIQSPQTATLGGTPYLGDFNNDGRMDLVIDSLAPASNRLVVGFGTASGAFTFPAGTQTEPDTPAEGWQAYALVFVGDVNGDGKADIVWTNPSSDAHIYVALAK